MYSLIYSSQLIQWIRYVLILRLFCVAISKLIVFEYIFVDPHFRNANLFPVLRFLPQFPEKTLSESETG